MFAFLAQVNEVDLSQRFEPAKRFGNLGQLVSLLGQLIALVGGLFVVVAFVYAAYKYLTAGDDSKNIDQAKQALTWSVVGLIVILTAYWVAQILQKVVGFDSGIF